MKHTKNKGVEMNLLLIYRHPKVNTNIKHGSGTDDVVIKYKNTG